MTLFSAEKLLDQQTVYRKVIITLLNTLPTWWQGGDIEAEAGQDGVSRARQSKPVSTLNGLDLSVSSPVGRPFSAH